MTDTVIPAWPIPAVPVSGGGVFPVRHIYCVGRNYAEHAREMGGDPSREPPFFFTKAPDHLVVGGGAVTYPPRTKSLHHEIELVVAIGKPGSNIAVAGAFDHIYGYAVGVDLTRRDLQSALREKGRPWDVAKGFAMGAPIGEIQPAAKIGHPKTGAITFSVNGEDRQKGDLADMVWRIDEVIAELSTYGPLFAGDLIYTGTPAGVGALVVGDRAQGHIDGVGDLAIEIVSA